jgi:hypothetical protein
MTLRGWGGREWTKGADAHPIGLEAEGVLSFEDGGVLSIERTNKEGRYEITLLRYWLDGREFDAIPRKPSASGARNFTVTCDAKVSGSAHTLRMVLRDSANKKWLADGEKTITSQTWTPVKIYLRADPTVDCRLRIDDQGVLEDPSSVQIKNLKLMEISSAPTAT